ncbi:MAG: PD40 domain-containing protein [Anaerolineae bacterium]|nr:PD40 domain-containing protein [Anaerolineae bacterium]
MLLFIGGVSIVVILLFSVIYFVVWNVMFNFQGTSSAAPLVTETPEPTDPPQLSSLLVESGSPTREPTVESSVETTVLPTTEPTAEPTIEPTIESTVEPTKPPVLPPPLAPTPTGKLAIPLAGAKIIIADVNGTFINQINGARQPNYWKFAADDSQPQLVVNGANAPFDQLGVFDGRGSTPHEIGNPGLTSHSHPVWSVDGSRILYDDNVLGCGAWCAYWRDSTKSNDTGDGQIFVASGNRPIVGANPLYPQWTTEDRIVFRSCASWAGGGGDCGLWVTAPYSEPTKLTNNANHIPTDVYGDTAVFVSNEVSGDDWNVYAVNLLDHTVRQLTSHPSPDGLATISPDGRWIAFVSQRDNSLAIWYLALDDSTPPQKLFDIPPSWGTLAPDAWYEEKLSWGR